MSRGHVLMVIRLLAGRRGGGERMFCETANLLAGAGYRVTAVHCETSSEPPAFPLAPGVTLVNLWERRARHGAGYRALDVLALGYRGGRLRAPVGWLQRNLYFVTRLRRIIGELRPDLVISFMPPANTPALIAGRLAGARVLPTNHNVPEQDYRSPTRWDQNPIDRFLRLRALRTAERVHVLFPDFARWFPEEIRDRLIAIPNFIAAEFLEPAADTERRPQVLSVGRLVAEKNHEVLLDAWALLSPRHPGWSLAIHGDGPLREALQQQIERLGLSRTATIERAGSDMPHRYRQAEILCHPALFEGFGLVVAEALACGLPVVAFADCAGVNQLVRDGDNGLLVDRSAGASALAAALERLIADAPFRARLRRAAPASIQAYSPEAVRRRWTEVIDELVGPGPRSGPGPAQ